MTDTVLACPELIEQCCRKVQHLDGCAAEIGVYRGMSAKWICEHLTCDVHLFDTFSGMPDICTSGLDYHTPGEFGNTSLKVVQEYLSDYQSRIVYHIGTFPNTSIPLPLKFVHIDCDLYTSTRDAVSWSWENLVEGGVILDDDYGTSSCAGAYKAINEFLERTPEAVIERVGTRAIIRRQTR